MTEQSPKRGDAETGSAAHILRLVSLGQATSRTDLAETLGLARSTISVRVQELLDAGLLIETGAGASRGGRRPRLLRMSQTGGFVLAADLGGRHVRLAAVDPTRQVVHAVDRDIDVAAGPETALAELLSAVGELRAHPVLSGRRCLGLGVGLPGPVAFPEGRVVGPSRMPGWHGYQVRAWLVQRLDIPVLVDNDANLLAVGEQAARGNQAEHLVVVKAGTGIGSGVVCAGQVHRGANGGAGDVSHARVAAAGEIPCSCGRFGCLETIASGAALVSALRDQGVGLETTADLVTLANDADPRVTAAVRFAGRQLGEVLSGVVNFFNPHAVLLSGRLATIEPYVAAVRGALYEWCLPMTTQNLEISVASTGADAGVIGAAVLVLQHVLDHWHRPLRTSGPALETSANVT